MCSTFYQMKISTDVEKFEALSCIFENNQGISTKYGWMLEFTQSDNDPYFDYIDYFTNLIEVKFVEIKKLGISKKDISIWIVFEYFNQFNTEFSPRILNKLAQHNLTLCITAYEVK